MTGPLPIKMDDSEIGLHLKLKKMVLFVKIGAAIVSLFAFENRENMPHLLFSALLFISFSKNNLYACLLPDNCFCMKVILTCSFRFIIISSCLS